MRDHPWHNGERKPSGWSWGEYVSHFLLHPGHARAIAQAFFFLLKIRLLISVQSEENSLLTCNEQSDNSSRWGRQRKIEVIFRDWGCFKVYFLNCIFFSLHHSCEFEFATLLPLCELSITVLSLSIMQFLFFPTREEILKWLLWAVTNMIRNAWFDQWFEKYEDPPYSFNVYSTSKDNGWLPSKCLE